MDDRKASLLAFGVGGLAIGGFWVARPTGPHASLKVVEQRSLPPQGVGDDKDAVTAFRVRLPAAKGDLSKESLVYRIVDRQGKFYPLNPMSAPGFLGAQKLSRGYPAPIDGPQIEAVLDGETIAREPVSELPKPVRTELNPKPNPLLTLIFHDGWLEARPRSPIPKNERWRVRAIRTPYTAVENVTAILPTRVARRPSSWLRVPYESRVDAVQVEILRYRLKESSELIDLPGFSLAHRFGGTSLTVQDSHAFPTHLGCVVRIPRQYMGPYRKGRSGDTRVASASVNLDFGIDTPFPDNPLPDQFATLEILSPRPEELGLRELRVGPGFLRADLAPGKSLKEGPFTVKARIKAYHPVFYRSERMVLPIEHQAPSANIWDRFGLQGRT